jgi:putative membrane protein
MGWMTSIFAVPRALIYWKRDFEQRGENGHLGDLTYRLYRFSAGLAVIAVLTGLWLAWQFAFPVWTHIKITAVALLAAHYVWTGVLVSRAKRGVFEQSDMYLRIFNELSVLGAIGILWLVVAQPF